MPTALVLSAGGMFAAWEIGVWKALAEHFTPDLIVGASAGAWNGWCIAGGATVADLIRDWMDPVTATLMQPGLHSTGFLRPDALHAKARELFDRYKPRIPFGLTVVEVPRMRVRLVRDEQIDWRYLAATCSIPMAFPPVTIDGKRYVDGGLMGALPLWAAQEMGATRVIALNCLTTLPFRILHRSLRWSQPRAEFDAIRIEPSQPLGSLRDTFRWSAANIERFISLGEMDGKRALASITM